jgi:hypothetical protein
MEKMHPPKYKALEDSASKCVVTEAPPTKTLAATDLAAAGENQPEVAQASPDDEAGPAHPHWCSPATDNDWPTHVNPQEMEESHQRKNHAGHHIECSLIHGPILQGFHHNNNGKRHEAVHLIPRNWPAAAPVAWRRPAQGFGLLGAVCTDAACVAMRRSPTRNRLSTAPWQPKCGKSIRAVQSLRCLR